jgi:hypothetical protein
MSSFEYALIVSTESVMSISRSRTCTGPELRWVIRIFKRSRVFVISVSLIQISGQVILVFSPSLRLSKCQELLYKKIDWLSRVWLFVRINAYWTEDHILRSSIDSVYILILAESDRCCFQRWLLNPTKKTHSAQARTKRQGDDERWLHMLILQGVYLTEESVHLTNRRECLRGVLIFFLYF